MTMGKTRKTNEYYVTCDDCGEILELDTMDFKTAVSNYEDEGWSFSRQGGEAHHFCKDCTQTGFSVVKGANDGKS